MQLVCVVSAALLLSPLAQATPLDTEKLKLLSCVMPVAAEAQPNQRAAMRWLYAAANSGDPVAFALSGPTTLVKACLKNVKVTATSSWRVKGAICNERLEEFVLALADIGVKLNRDGAGEDSTGFLTARGDGFQYSVTEGTVDKATGKVTDASFSCIANTH